MSSVTEPRRCIEERASAAKCRVFFFFLQHLLLLFLLPLKAFFFFSCVCWYFFYSLCFFFFFLLLKPLLMESSFLFFFFDLLSVVWELGNRRLPCLLWGKGREEQPAFFFSPFILLYKSSDMSSISSISS